MPKLPDKSQQTQEEFDAIHQMIQAAKAKSMQQINTNLIELYWRIGGFIREQVAAAGWGKGVVDDLATYLAEKEPNHSGFSARNLWRMKQFYETYAEHPKLPALLTEISWTNHLHVMSKTKTLEEKEFYLNLASQKRYPERDFARLIDSGVYERTCLADQKLSAALTEFPVDPKGIFKDSYVFDFLSLHSGHKEADLKHALLANLRHFLLELGADFSYLGEEYLVQVGMRDFRIDLLMHHRGPNCLVAIELKVTEFGFLTRCPRKFQRSLPTPGTSGLRLVLSFKGYPKINTYV